MDDGISDAERFYDCCECCEGVEPEVHGAGRDLHLEPCPEGCND
jgi:hypothetical protein